HEEDDRRDRGADQTERDPPTRAHPTGRGGALCGLPLDRGGLLLGLAADGGVAALRAGCLCHVDVPSATARGPGPAGGPAAVRRAAHACSRDHHHRVWAGGRSPCPHRSPVGSAVVEAIWMRLPQVSSNTAVVTVPMSSGSWVNRTPSARSRS